MRITSNLNFFPYFMCRSNTKNYIEEKFAKKLQIKLLNNVCYISVCAILHIFIEDNDAIIF